MRSEYLTEVPGKRYNISNMKSAISNLTEMSISTLERVASTI